jgi:osmoprotectant transport system permease protein
VTRIAALAALVAFSLQLRAETPIVVGSKNFTEGYLLAEIIAQTLEESGFEVERRFGFGGTKIAYEALRAGEIDIYPEYTGTIREVLLQEDRELPEAALSAALGKAGLQMLPSLGFNNTYALAVSPGIAAMHGLEKISDLAATPDLRAAFSHEFLNRPDGWPGLKAAYRLALMPTGIEHGLAYQAIDDRAIDLTDTYSTDGELQRYRLRLLEDDREFFPRYLAVPLARAALHPAAVSALASLADTLDDAAMRRLNAAVVVDRLPIPEVAAGFLDVLQGRPSGASNGTDLIGSLVRNTSRHLTLTAAALLLAGLVGTGLAVAVHQSPRWSGAVLYAAGLLQTIPSIALLALMIPLLGVGVVPAVTALFLYSLLPILRNTITALTTTDPVCREVAQAIGLSRGQQLRYVLLPLAAPHILAGVRTAAVISIGTATLAAFIGAGGLGEPIVTGLALNDTTLILQGAIPAALLAILTELAFSGLERTLIPAHLRVS